MRFRLAGTRPQAALRATAGTAAPAPAAAPRIQLGGSASKNTADRARMSTSPGTMKHSPPKIAATSATKPGPTDAYRSPRRDQRMVTMEIEVLHVPECPNVAPLLDDIRAVIGDRSDVTITTSLVSGDVEAAAIGFAGSPTVLIDGLDPFATGAAQAGLSCRLYLTETGPVGRPSRAQIEVALRRRDQPRKPQSGGR